MNRDAYLEKMKARLDQWNAEIDVMQARAREVEADARIRYEQYLQELREQRDEAEARLQEARNASEAAWKDIRTGIEAAWDDMAKAFNDALKRFG